MIYIPADKLQAIKLPGGHILEFGNIKFISNTASKKVSPAGLPILSCLIRGKQHFVIMTSHLMAFFFSFQPAID